MTFRPGRARQGFVAAGAAAVVLGTGATACTTSDGTSNAGVSRTSSSAPAPSTSPDRRASAWDDRQYDPRGLDGLKATVQGEKGCGYTLRDELSRIGDSQTVQMDVTFRGASDSSVLLAPSDRPASGHDVLDGWMGVIQRGGTLVFEVNGAGGGPPTVERRLPVAVGEKFTLKVARDREQHRMVVTVRSKGAEAVLLDTKQPEEAKAYLSGDAKIDVQVKKGGVGASVELGQRIHQGPTHPRDLATAVPSSFGRSAGTRVLSGIA